jgi:hypothetical protein
MKAMKVGYCNFNFRFVTNFWDNKEMSFMGWKIKYKQSKRKRSGARPRTWTSQNIGQEEIVEDYETKNKNIEVHDPWSFSSLYIYNSRYKNATSKFCCIFLRSWFHISVPDSLLLACQATRSYTINSLKLTPPPKSVLELTLLVGRYWLQITHSLMMIIITMMVVFHTVGWVHEWVDIQMADEYGLISPFPKSGHTLQLSQHDHQHQQNQRLQLIHI